MLYLSQLLGASVEDLQGARIGKIVDVLMPLTSAAAEAPSPHVLVIEGQQEGFWRVPPTDLEPRAQVLRLRVPLTQLVSQPPESVIAPDVSLAHEVMDRQVIDVKRRKAVRVNDVCFADDWRILGIDNSPLGLIRRLTPAWFFGVRGKQGPVGLIPWQRIEPLWDSQPAEEAPTPAASLQPAQPRPQSGPLSELRAADIADIVHQLTPSQGAQLIERLDDETAADTLEEVDTERQSDILERISVDRAADILQAMSPDEAADLVARLPEERAQALLRLMTPEESEDVQELLEYAEDSAGGLMTTDFIYLSQERTVSEALETMRRNIIDEDIHAVYVYCVEVEQEQACRLLGVVSVWNLLVASPEQALRELMKTDLVSVLPEADPREVAEVLAKYNLYAVPVVNGEGDLQGIITVDDALDVLLPPERRRRPSRMY